MAYPLEAASGAPRQFHVVNDGLRTAVLDWGGVPGARPVVLLHPNGFCAGLYDPIARRLAGSGAFRPIGVDLRGHGASDKPEPPEPYHYEGMAGDVVAVLDELGLADVDIVGGSLGGGTAIHVDRVAPGRARRLMLCEPVAFPIGPEAFPAAANAMVTAALRRRVIWPSRQAMIESYGSRAPLDQLAPEALAAYVEWGTIDRADGQVELACPPAAEAAIFGGSPALTGVNRAWEHLPKLAASVAFLAGTRTTMPEERFRAAADQAGVPVTMVEGGHFLLHENTARGVALIEEHLGIR
jgi:pimeloyl-ACP methyl ester carboxylesterase